MKLGKLLSTFQIDSHYHLLVCSNRKDINLTISNYSTENTTYKEEQIDIVVGIESRGFIMAGAIAYNLNTAFVPLRKPNKLPSSTFKVTYSLEYGSTDMHIHKDALDGLTNLLIIDDLLATGGTVLAAIDLINNFKGKNIIGAGFIINLPDLGGYKKLYELKIRTKYLMEFNGS